MKWAAADRLFERREIWKDKKILRKLYRKWYRVIGDALKPGKTLELGGGSGNLKEFFPEAVTSDIVFAPWLDTVLDAQYLPFKDESLDNIVLFDVLHHLTAPALFFVEAERVLRPKGRIVMMEPYISWSSFLVYRFLHFEGMNWSIDPFESDSIEKSKDPFHGNQAIPTLLFERDRDRFVRHFPRLKIVKEERMDFIIYPMSGGFHNVSLCPVGFWKALSYFETLMNPLGHYLAFRLFVTVEKG